MGAWSVSIMGNDTAMDLKEEYKIAFVHYSPEEAIEKLDEYCESEYKDEIHEYYYSVALFMWEHGILTQTVKDRAVEWIDNERGLEVWEEAGASTLKKRKEALQKFKEKLNSEMPAKKKIKAPPKELSFEIGDMAAIQMLAGKYAGFYVVLKKIYSNKNITSSIFPGIYEEQSVYVLYDYLNKNLPNSEDLMKMKILDKVDEKMQTFFTYSEMNALNGFVDYAGKDVKHYHSDAEWDEIGKRAKIIESCMPDIKYVFGLHPKTEFQFKKRKYQVVGNSLSDCEKTINAIKMAKSDKKYFLYPTIDFDYFDSKILNRFLLNGVII